MNRYQRLACILFCATIILRTGPHVRGDDVPRQPWSKIAAYPGKGLTPLYDLAAKELKRILTGNQRWATLPRPITHVRLRSDRAPCFEMHNGDTYYNKLYGNAEAIRWAAEQEWDGEFRLLLNSSLQAVGEDDLWLTVDGYQPVLRSLHRGKWRTYRPLGSDRFSRTRRAQLRLVEGSSERWWLASGAGLFQLQKGTLRRERIPGWPDTGVRGVVSDHQGRVAAWSPQDTEGQTTMAFFNDGEWSTATVVSADWNAAAIRPDGIVVLAGHRRVRFAAPPGSELSVPFAVPQSEEDPDKLALGQLPLGDDWIQPQGHFALSPKGELLFLAARVSDGSLGFVRVPLLGNAEWIEFSDPSRIQLAAMSGGDFLMLTRDRGMFRLAAGSHEPLLVTDKEETMADDRLLGCDHRGRVYLGRGRATLVFSSDGKPTESVQVGTQSVVRSPGSGARIGYSAALDSTGLVWTVGPDGAVNTLEPGSKPELFDDRLTDAASLWPGRDGSMLVLNKNGSASLVLGDGTIVAGATLFELASASLARMHAAAPIQSCDRREDLRSQAGSRFLASPWLAIGDSLWISDGTTVDRLRTGGVAAEVQNVQTGNFDLMGPLRSGQLVLADRSNSRITSWHKVDKPDGEMAVQRIGAPPAKQAGAGTLSRPESYAGSWYLDSQGWLWLHQGFDRVYRIESADEWFMLKDFGAPVIEHPAGFVWGNHKSRVFNGYQVGGTSKPRSCRPTYQEHLTPLVVENDEVVCLTPTGLAWLRFDRQSPEGDEITRSMPINWGGIPAAFVGVRDQKLWVVVENGSVSTLVSVSLQGQ